MSKEIKRITVGSIFSWTFGILFLIFDVSIMGSGSPIEERIDCVNCLFKRKDSINK